MGEKKTLEKVIEETFISGFHLGRDLCLKNMERFAEGKPPMTLEEREMLITSKITELREKFREMV